MKKLFCVILLFLLLAANVGHSQFLDSEPIFGQQLNLGHWSTDGLIGLWRFIQAGTLIDESFYRNHGTITNATWTADGLDFDGAGDYVNLGAMLPANADFTVGAEVETSDIDSSEHQVLFNARTDNDDSFILYITTTFGTANAELRLYATGNEVCVGSDVENTGWRHIVVTRRGDDWKIYLDGLEDASGTEAGAIKTTLFLAIRAPELDRAMDGQMRHAFLYNRALSAPEIQELYINPDLPMQQEPIWLFYSPAGNIGALMQAERESKTGGKQCKAGGKQ